MDAALNWLWQGIAVATAAAVLLRLLDRTRAQTRYLLCGVALAAIAALPLMSTPGNSASATIPESIESASGVPAHSTSGFSSPTSAALLTIPDAWWTSTTTIIFIWVGWLAFQTARAGVAIARVRRARARTWPISRAVETRFTTWMHVRNAGRRAQLVISPDIRAAAVLGAGRPLIALAPSLFDRLTDEEIDRLITHEWAHVRRRDDWAALAQLAARAIAGWHPGYRWIERRLQIEREIACDEAVVSTTGSAKAYAACLVKLASLVPPPAERVMALAALSSPPLSTRVARLVSPARSSSHIETTAFATGGIALLMCVTLAVGAIEAVSIATTAAAPPTPLITAPQPSASIDRQLTSHQRPAAAGSPRTIAGSPARAAANDQSVPDNGERSQPRGAHAPHVAQTIQPAQPVAEPLLTPVPLLDRDLPQGGSIELPVSIVLSPPASAGPDGRTPWGAAAEAGVAIGRGSKKAGVATAGFFSRVGKRIAGSF